MAGLVTLFVGHRGTGKTTFVQRLHGVRALDLDQAIEKSTGTPVADLLQRDEKYFRQQEAEVLARLVSEAKVPTAIAVGAGFEGPLPADAHVVWLRRESDRDGRSFLNRPRLDQNLSPYAEYMERFPAREARFRAWAHEELFVPEGYEFGLEDFISPQWHVPFDLTLLPENFGDLPQFVSKRLGMGVRRFELRDDLLSDHQLAAAKALIPASRILFSCRRSKQQKPDGAIDWPMEWGVPAKQEEIVSLHSREPGTLRTSLDLLKPEYGRLLKAALPVTNLAELEEGHRWWQEDPQHRAFLPCSSDGRWRWYRSLFGPQMPIHFFREGEGSALDQPMLWQCVMQPQLQRHFAAVLGFPIHHSRTPMEQLEFFKGRQMPVVAIAIEDDLARALPVLQRFGLSHAAVTSPLKSSLYHLAHEMTAEARTLRSANTLYVVDGRITVHNTDYLALKELARQLGEKHSVWVWGRGALRETVVKVWPGAKVFSARAGTEETFAPDLLIWATNRSRPFSWPKSAPQSVLDLNYGDDSPGLELAVKANLPYQSGLKMFKLQAEFQRQFWSQF